MSNDKQTKINQLLQIQPPGTVFLTSWLEKNGYSHGLQRRYRDSGWLKSIGNGAMIRHGDDVNWLGAVYSLQNQAGYDLHIGARSAINLLGIGHYIELNQKEALLFAPRGIGLPAWFRKADWGIDIKLHNTDFLPVGLGLTVINEKTFRVKISNPARAILECLYLSPNQFSLTEAFQLMEGLATLKPADVQELLENCNSVKVVRLFLYMAIKANHSWSKHLKLKNINTGKGKRNIVKGGVFIPEFQITIPEELFMH